MLLRRVMEHVKTQNWFAVALDFVIVVFGVFVGLQVQEWAEERERAGIEVIYTTRMYDEVTSLQSTREPLSFHRHRLRDEMITATALIFGDEDRELTTEECNSIALSYVVSNPTDDLASLIELQSSGGLSLFKNEEVLAALRRFLLARARAGDSRAGIFESIIELPADYPELIKVSLPSDVMTEPLPTLATYQCDLEGMRASQTFLNDYEINQVNYAFHVRDVASVDESLEALRSVLGEVLSIKPEEES